MVILLKVLGMAIAVFIISVVVLLASTGIFQDSGYLDDNLPMSTEEYKDYISSAGNITDGVLDARYFEEIQEAIDFAYDVDINIIQLEGITYDINTSVLIYSGMTLQGVTGKTIISMTGVNQPVIRHTGDITGYTVIRDLTITGDVTKSNNTGIILNDYYSMIDNVVIADVGGHGVELSTEGASGTLVENKVINCVVRNAQGISYFLGDDDNGALTDGFLINCISDGSEENYAVVIGSSAGWLVNGLHIYNHSDANTPIYARSGYNTTMTNVYIEGFLDYAIQFSACQLNINISNISVISSGNDAKGVFVFDSSSAFDFPCNVNIANVSVLNSYADNLDIITGNPNNMQIQVYNVNATGNMTTNIVSPGMARAVTIS